MSARWWAKRLFRIATLVVPSALAWYVAFAQAEPGDLAEAVELTLGPLWLLLVAALVMRVLGATWDTRRARTVSIIGQIDVLTGAGSALAWTSAFAIVAAVWLGWASLAVVGLLGSGLFHVVVLLTFVAVRGADPMRAASITRSFVPEVVTEGDAVVEQLHFSGARIPIGFRLFASGRIGPRWATSRHVLDAAEAGSDLVLESEVGPAVRGEHDPEPLVLWLQDTFGLCRSLRVAVGGPRLTVLPRVRTVPKAARLLARGDGPRAPRPTTRLPTEGLFRLREYQQGDDVRRIHWVRSLAARELIVRLPDELPPDQPRVRLVLDTYFPEAGTLACDAPDELLDWVVGVWLAVGRSLAESGARVTLVAAVPEGAEGAIAKARHDLVRRAPTGALRLGAKVRWQSSMPVDALLTDEPAIVVSRANIGRTPEHAKVGWIVVLPDRITPEPAWPFPHSMRLPHPQGSSDNRWSRRRRAANRVATARRDHAWALAFMGREVQRPLPGCFLACPQPDGTIRLENLG